APEPARAIAHSAPRLDDALARRDRAPEAKADRPMAAAAEPAAPPVATAEARGGGLSGIGADDKLAEGNADITSDSDASYDAAMAAYRDGRYSEAQRRFGEIADQGGDHAANAALYEVQALRMVSGCPSAAPRFEDVHTRYPGAVGNSAAWQAADCYRSLGEVARARQNYDELASDPNYKARASEAIAELDQRAADQESAARKGAAAAAGSGKKAPAASAPAKPAGQ
ncbi:MAG TPA: hypothetical protein VHW01_23985, partial [Polyangiaceae bacterium]|nr:hypothetical protein [Polyangiaceae bacterium]